LLARCEAIVVRIERIDANDQRRAAGTNSAGISKWDEVATTSAWL